jgi:hypothetical protein
MYHFPGVCFCDIPVADLSLHIGKYSAFGIAFTKRFLVKRGASPVFYIAKDSDIDPGGNAEAGMRQSSAAPYTRAVLFNEMIASFHKSAHTLLRLASTVTASDGPKARELAEASNSLAQLAPYINEYVFSYCVPFDSTLDESDKPISIWNGNGEYWEMSDSHSQTWSEWSCRANMPVPSDPNCPYTKVSLAFQGDELAFISGQCSE